MERDLELVQQVCGITVIVASSNEEIVNMREYDHGEMTGPIRPQVDALLELAFDKTELLHDGLDVDIPTSAGVPGAVDASHCPYDLIRDGTRWWPHGGEP
jgi:hypothetical protein